MTATLTSWFPAFDVCESWTVVSRKQKKSSFFKYRKQSFCGEPRGSERSLFQVCCPGPGSVSKESDSGPSFSFSVGIPGSFSESQLDILNDPAVKGLEAMLRVRERGGPSYPPLCHLRVDSCVPPPARRFSGSGSETDLQEPVPTVFFDKSAKSVNPGGARASLASAGVSRAARNPCPVVEGGKPAHATAGESDRNLGSSHDVVTRFSSINSCGESSRARMSYLDAVLSAPARAPAAALVARCSAPSSAAVGLCMHDDGSSVHGARNSGGTGGLLPVQRSTSYCLENSWSDTGRVQGPTGTRRVKGGGFRSGRRFASCLRGGGRG